MADFIFWGSKITADGDCSHEMTKLDSILKSRDITLSICLVKAMVQGDTQTVGMPVSAGGSSEGEIKS